MLFSVEQAFVGRDEIRAPLKTPAWEATYIPTAGKKSLISQYDSVYSDVSSWVFYSRQKHSISPLK